MEEDLIEEENKLENEKPKLGKKVFFLVIIGIILVFPSMMLINGFIFKHTSQIKTAYYFSIIASNLLFVIVILVIKIGNKLSWAQLGWKKSSLKKGIKDVFIVWGIIWLIHIFYMLILFFYGISPTENELEKLLSNPSFLVLILNVLLVAIVAAVVEEALFRGLLFSSMRSYLGCWTAIILSAAIFSALHFELIGFVPRFVLGVGLGYLYVKHQSIYPSIALHGLNNFLAIMMISSVS